MCLICDLRCFPRVEAGSALSAVAMRISGVLSSLVAIILSSAVALPANKYSGSSDSTAQMDSGSNGMLLFESLRSINPNGWSAIRDMIRDAFEDSESLESVAENLESNAPMALNGVIR